MGEVEWMSLLGGGLIGVSASVLLLFNGQILGISGIFSGLLREPQNSWRLVFFLGLFMGGVALNPLGYSVMSLQFDRSLLLIAIGGLLVGVGTGLGNGCTSGHGVCGVSRLSVRSIWATMTFILSGVATVALLGVV